MTDELEQKRNNRMQKKSATNYMLIKFLNHSANSDGRGTHLSERVLFNSDIISSFIVCQSNKPLLLREIDMEFIISKGNHVPK